MQLYDIIYYNVVRWHCLTTLDSAPITAAGRARRPVLVNLTPKLLPTIISTAIATIIIATSITTSTIIITITITTILMHGTPNWACVYQTRVAFVYESTYISA